MMKVSWKQTVDMRYIYLSWKRGLYFLDYQGLQNGSIVLTQNQIKL